VVDPNEDDLELVDSRYGVWRERYREERDRIRTALDARGLGDRLERIEHVGSTAVPGLAAKDIVDVDVVVADGAVAAVADALATELDGDRFENSDGWNPVFRMEGGQRFNDHVFEAGAEGWRVSVATREVLRAHADFRREYEALKRELAAEHDDLVAYSEGKTAFVERVLERARADSDLEFGFELP